MRNYRILDFLLCALLVQSSAVAVVNSEGDLNTEIGEVNAGTRTNITFGSSFSLTGDLATINSVVAPGLTIDGAGFTLTGASNRSFALRSS